MHSHIISFNFLYLGIIYQIIFKIPILLLSYILFYNSYNFKFALFFSYINLSISYLKSSKFCYGYSYTTI